MKPFEQQTYYELLEIPVTAPEAAIREAYTRAIETYSPDSVAVYTLVDPGQVDALRARLTEAMEILTEPDLRAEYDRMIGVSGGEPGAVVALAPALAAAAQAVQPQESVAAASKPVSPTGETPAAPVASAPAASTSHEPAAGAAAAEAEKPTSAPETATPAAPAPIAASAVLEPTPATPEPAPAPAAAAPEPSSAPTPAVPAAVAPLVMPGVVTPSQIHAAFRSYAISYVPVLVPAPSVTGSAFLSPFTPPAQASTPQAGPEISGEAKASEPVAPSTPSAPPAVEPVAAQGPTPAAEPVPPPVSAPPSTAETAPPSTSAAVQSSPPSAPVTPAVADAPRSTAAQGSSAPARPTEAAPEPAAPEKPTPAVVHHEEDEPSGVRAPPPSPGVGEARAQRPIRPTPTPPPLPPGGRRVARPTPAVQPASPVGEVGKGSARPGQASGMDLEEAQQIAQESAIATAEAALAQVAAKAREPRPKPIDLPPNTEFNGEVLRQVRESRALTLQQVAERTRISAKHLENVEADRYSALPATVYLRGILMNLARELGLDPLKVSRSYLALATGPKKK